VPVGRLNNVSTPLTDDYTDALTVVFPHPRPGFALSVFNATIYYQLAAPGLSARDVQWEVAEHFLAPSFNNFNNPVHEDLPPGTLFAGIRIRTAILNTPARVTVN
jgi:hypothetical protein